MQPHLIAWSIFSGASSKSVWINANPDLLIFQSHATGCISLLQPIHWRNYYSKRFWWVIIDWFRSMNPTCNITKNTIILKKISGFRNRTTAAAVVVSFKSQFCLAFEMSCPVLSCFLMTLLSSCMGWFVLTHGGIEWYQIVLGDSSIPLLIRAPDIS